jgi:hypothetical protein
VAAALASVPPAVAARAGGGADLADGSGRLTPPAVAPDATVTTLGGKPLVLWVGAEFCPFCAAERWPLAVALSRFGRFTGLHETTSSATAVFPATASLSFVGTGYSSPYVSFEGVELYSSQVGADGSFTRIGGLTPAEQALARQVGDGSVRLPLVDVAGVLTTTTSAFSPSILAGLSSDQIASALAQEPSTPAPSTPTTRGATPSTTTTTVPSGGSLVQLAVVAAANQLTAGICRASGGLPVAVCSAPGVQSADRALGLG